MVRRPSSPPHLTKPGGGVAPSIDQGPWTIDHLHLTISSFATNQPTPAPDPPSSVVRRPSSPPHLTKPGGGVTPSIDHGPSSIFHPNQPSHPLILKAFIVGAVVSFIGSIPPGTLNILVLQLGFERKLKAAMRFALAVALIEYPYAWIAVAFEGWITSSPAVQQNFKLLASVVMLTLGVLGLWYARKPSKVSTQIEDSGFVRGLILSLLNPQAIPWWVGMTAYLKAQGWITLDSTLRLHSFVLGTAVGTLALLTLFAFAANRIAGLVKNNRLVAILPSIILIVLGTAALISIYV